MRTIQVKQLTTAQEIMEKIEKAVGKDTATSVVIDALNDVRHKYLNGEQVVEQVLEVEKKTEEAPKKKSKK